MASFDLRRTLGLVDGLQRRHAVLALPYAALKRFGEANAGGLAASIAYYGLFSLFPLLLVLTSAAGIVLRDRPELQERVVGSALAQFPVIGTQIRADVGSIGGSMVAVTVGLLLALWAGIGGIRAAQLAIDTVQDVPRRARRRTLGSVAMALVLLLALGAYVVLVAVLGLVGTAGPAGLALTWTVSTVLNVLLFAGAYRVLVSTSMPWSSTIPGACLAGVAWTLLLGLGARIVSHQVASASDVYGTFAIVIGLLAWIYLGAQVLLVGAVLNVVVADRLWPRSFPGTETEADRRALTRSARQEERVPRERVTVTLEPPSDRRGAPT